MNSGSPLPPALTPRSRPVAFTDNKWRLSNGGSTFYADVEDGEFRSRIEAGEAFRKGDSLRCRIRVEQYRNEEGQLRADHVVTEVIEHIPRGEQMQLGDGDVPDAA